MVVDFTFHLSLIIHIYSELNMDIKKKEVKKQSLTQNNSLYMSEDRCKRRSKY